MNHQHKAFPSPPLARTSPLPIRMAQRLEELDIIADDDHINSVIWDAAIWQRRLPSFVTRALAANPIEADLERRVNTALDNVSAYARDFLQPLNAVQSAALDWLATDIAALAAQFAQAMSIDAVALRIEVVTDDACRKFHRDAVKARLICTYHGPGTEYGLARSGDEPTNIHSVPTGCPVVLKGRIEPDASRTRLVHRSPPLGDSGAWRLVVVINEPT